MPDPTDSRFTSHPTRDNTAVVIVDHQVGLYAGVHDIAVEELKHNVVALAKAAGVLGLPLVVTTTMAGSMWGPTIPELLDVLPSDLKIIDRTTVNAWDDPRVAAAVRATGRTHLVIAGILTEVSLALPAISATAEGFTAYGAVDASGTFGPTKRDAGLLRMQQVGAIPIDYATAMVEIMADNADPAAGEVYAALDLPFAVLLGQLAASYTRHS
jgi:nicotinamidase-related amidase